MAHTPMQTEDHVELRMALHEEVRSGRSRPLRRLVVSDQEFGECCDYVSFARCSVSDDSVVDAPVEIITESDCLMKGRLTGNAPDEAIVFLSGTITPRTLKVCSLLLQLSQHIALRCIVIIPSLRSHFVNSAGHDLECLLKERLKPQLAALTILRTGFILSRNSPVARWCRRLWWTHSLLDTRLSSTFVTLSRLHRIVDEELEIYKSKDRSRTLVDTSGVRRLTVLGDRRSWKSMCIDQQKTTPAVIEWFLSLLCSTAALLGLGWFIKVWAQLLSRWSVTIRRLTFQTLNPQSFEELQQLCNRHSCDDIQIAGYNNGVNHFGWKFPSKTIIQTTSLPVSTQLEPIAVASHEESDSHRSSHTLENLANGRFTVSSGLTLKHCIHELAESSREFFVIPNYSYISMGTLFFVPVHGSGSRVSTLGDTIDAVELWNSRTETIVRLRRGEEQFQAAMYNTKAHWVVQKLTLLVRNKETYTVRRETLDDVTADGVLGLLNEPQWSNVEIRKSQASSSTIEVSRYRVTEQAEAASVTLDAPRDRIGRVWDRLEETPIVSTLFHWFVRTFAFHVELFLSPDEFRIFWNHHQSLPVSKIQLRRVLKDGLPNSACQHTDCVSADLFMTRGKRDVFCQFVEQHIPNVRTNPGKQSF